MAKECGRSAQNVVVPGIRCMRCKALQDKTLGYGPYTVTAGDVG